MSRSYRTAATNVGKLYAAVNDMSIIDDTEVYPMADGLYLLHQDKNELATSVVALLRDFGVLANNRIEDSQDSFGPWLGFLLRAGFAKGTVYHGRDVDPDGDSDLADVDWIDHVPFGEPISNAHHSENGLPPFGIGLHESIVDDVDPGEWKWWKECEDHIRDDIIGYLDVYFTWADDNIDSLLYDEANLSYHVEQSETYFELSDGYFGII